MYILRNAVILFVKNLVKLYLCFAQERAEKELEKLKDQIAQKEKELELLKPKYEEMKKREEDCTREYVLLLVSLFPS